MLIGEVSPPLSNHAYLQIISFLCDAREAHRVVVGFAGGVLIVSCVRVWTFYLSPWRFQQAGEIGSLGL